MRQTSPEPDPTPTLHAAAVRRAPVAVTGIKASGRAHLGNLLGMIRPALALAASHDAHYFIADAHALTTLRDGAALRRHTREIAATWLALGLDPHRTTLYRQSDLPEVFELAWILACYTGKGLLNRAHAYKAAVAANRAAGRALDHARGDVAELDCRTSRVQWRAWNHKRTPSRCSSPTSRHRSTSIGGSASTSETRPALTSSAS